MPDMQFLTTFTFWDEALKIVLPVGGLAAAYMRFAMGKIYNTRVEPTVKAKCIKRDGRDYILISTEVKNTGVTALDFMAKETFMRLKGCPHTAVDTAAAIPDWVLIQTLPAFANQEWLEVGEVVRDQALLALPPQNCLAYRVELRVQGKKLWWERHHKVWDAVFVLVPENAAV